MGLIGDLLLPSARPEVWPRLIDHSVLLDGVDDYLHRTPATAGNRRTWTFSTWIKNVKRDTSLLTATQSLNVSDWLHVSPAGALALLAHRGSQSATYRQWTYPVLVDPTAHYHVVVSIDTTQGTASERVRFFLNGVRLDIDPRGGGDPTYPLNEQTYLCSTVQHNLGRYNETYPFQAGCYLAETVFVDGQALGPDAFGEWSDRVTGLWMPKPYTGTYGTTGFRLDYGNAAALGADVSGNGNNLTVVGGPVQTMDTPTNNHCTLNPLTPSAGALSNGNLTLASGTAKPTIQPESGQWYYEKDGVGISYDADVSGRFQPDLPAGTYNFGATAWADTGPTGAEKALCATNLPDPTILRSGTVTDIVLRQGTGASASVESLEFAPDFVLIKGRSTATNWQLTDSERGANRQLRPNTNAAEYALTDIVTALNPDGYDLGANADVNDSGYSFLDLCLQAGPMQGFEIVTHTGDGTYRTLPHNLGKTPTFIIGKVYGPTLPAIYNGWYVWHRDLPMRRTLILNGTSAALDDNGVWGVNENAHTATQFPVGLYMNQSGYTYVFYVFTDSDIFKAFSYTGNANVNGPFVNLGGRPLWTVLKNASAEGGWVFINSATMPVNMTDPYMLMNLTQAEASGEFLNYTSNGLKITNNAAGTNGTTNLVVGLAVMQSTKYANAF